MYETERTTLSRSVLKQFTGSKYNDRMGIN